MLYLYLIMSFQGFLGLKYVKIPLSSCLKCAGPVVAEAMFLNREEVPVHPVYRDPVSGLLFF